MERDMIGTLVVVIVAAILNFHLSVLLASILKRLGILRKQTEYGPVNAWIRVHLIIAIVALFRWTFTIMGREIMTRNSDRIPWLKNVKKGAIAQTILGAGAFNRFLADAVFAQY